ncbi:MAG: efflux RND transporter periplasmic adaptor subunit [Phycisphaerales bacterium]|nr:efflux RND transporter periplasmic adaptor subunit [Phycisphaerales bacterium]
MASNILAKVIEADLRAGQEVKKDQVLIRLEQADLRARLQQAQAGFRDAVSARERAKSDLEQLQQLFDRQASTKRELDNAQTTLERAQAMVDRANQAILEAQTVMDYATIKAPMDGIIIDKLVNVGDTVTPGQVLVNLYDPSKMQVVASVREALAQQLEVGRTVRVELESMDLVCKANISEIVPESAGSSRSFAVKVTGPCPPGVHVGTFARLLMDMGTQETLVIPADAVQRVGQLDLVNVMNQKRTQWQRRVIKPGRLVEDGKSIEVLSGLKAGELVIVLPAEGRGHE